MKPWFQSRTLYLGILIIGGGIAEYLASLPPGVALATVVSGCLTIILRFLTNQAIGNPPATPAVATNIAGEPPAEAIPVPPLVPNSATIEVAGTPPAQPPAQ